MGVLYVTSLHKGDGKTAFCTGLAYLLKQKGQHATLFKPLGIASPINHTLEDADAIFFTHLQGTSPSEDWPIVLTSQEYQEGLQPETRRRVLKAYNQQTAQSTAVIVEGPPLTNFDSRHTTMASELSEALGAKVVLLVGYTPKLTAQEIMDASKALGDCLTGIVINGVLRYQSHHAQESLVAQLEEHGVPILGILPEERCLLGVTVGDLARHIDGEFLAWESKRDQLVDHILIGGMVLDSGIHYFARSNTKAVLVRGDRPDIQMAALSTPTRCLVLTGGHQPIQYVEYEAKEEDVPVILVQTDTLTTAKALDSLFDGATIHHQAKVECFANLLMEGVNMEVIFSALESK